MDLGTVKRNLDAGHYPDPGSLLLDLRQVPMPLQARPHSVSTDLGLLCWALYSFHLGFPVALMHTNMILS